MPITGLKKKLKSGFARNVLTLMSGTAIAQVLPIIISPLLTRLYTPDDFGIFGFYTSIISILAVIATARYELAIMLPDDEDDAYHVLALSIIVCLLISGFIFITILLFNNNFSFLVNNYITSTDVSGWLYFVPVSVFIIGTYHSLNYWFNRQKKYRRLAVNSVSQSIVTSLSNMGIGFTSNGPGGLIFGGMIGLGTSTLLLFLESFTNSLSKLRFSNVIRSAMKYIDFPKKSTFGAMLNILASQLPTILVGVWFSPLVLGFYVLTVRILNSPMVVIGGAVSNVFYQKATQSYKEGTLIDLVVNTTKYLLLIISAPMAILFFFGADIFALFFGEEWREAGKIAGIMAPFFLVRFVISSQSTIVMVLRKIEYEVRFNFCYFIGQLSSLLVGWALFRSYVISFTLMSLTGVIIYCTYGYFIYKHLIKTGRSSLEDS